MVDKIGNSLMNNYKVMFVEVIYKCFNYFPYYYTLFIFIIQTFTNNMLKNSGIYLLIDNFSQNFPIILLICLQKKIFMIK